RRYLRSWEGRLILYQLRRRAPRSRLNTSNYRETPLGLASLAVASVPPHSRLEYFKRSPNVGSSERSIFSQRRRAAATFAPSLAGSSPGQGPAPSTTSRCCCVESLRRPRRPNTRVGAASCFDGCVTTAGTSLRAAQAISRTSPFHSAIG